MTQEDEMAKAKDDDFPGWRPQEKQKPVADSVAQGWAARGTLGGGNTRLRRVRGTVPPTTGFC